MNAALLNVRITIQKSEVEIDTIGNHKPTWQDYYVCAATAGGEEGKRSVESASAGMTVDHADITFTLRFCKKAAAIEPTGFRVLFGGEIYNILSVDHMNYKKKALKFKCEKARR